MWPSLWGEWGEAKWRRVKSRMSVLHAQFRPGCNWWARVLQLCCCSEAIISAFLSAWERLSEAWEEKVWRAVVRDSAQCEMAAEVMGFHAWQTGHSCFLLNPDLELSDESKCSLSHHNYGHERRGKKTKQKNSPCYFLQKEHTLQSLNVLFLISSKCVSALQHFIMFRCF